MQRRKVFMTSILTLKFISLEAYSRLEFPSEVSPITPITYFQIFSWITSESATLMTLKSFPMIPFEINFSTRSPYKI